MPHQIISIDAIEQHRRVLRHFIQQTYPDIELIEYDLTSQGKPGADFDWSQYDLLIIDTELVHDDGLDWIEEFKTHNNFPAWIILSSASEEDASREIVRGIKLGAEDFLFKKGLQVKALYKAINKTLSSAGYELSVAKPPGKTSKSKVKPSQKNKIIANINVDDTQHEMQLAMAMLHGQGNWPFTMADILAHKAHIGSYQITSYLGHGHSTTNFIGTNPKIKSPVVVRLVNQTLTNDKNFISSFEKEFDKITQWHHPNLIHYHEYERIGERIIIIHEHLPGDTLHDIIARARFGPDQAIEYMLQLLDALKYLHENHTLVGSFTPYDILMKDRYTLVLSEYGLMRRLHAISHITAELTMSEKPFYVTPEAVQDRHSDERSDLYLAGIIFYELLTGHPPFHAGSIQDILYGHVAMPVPDLPMKNDPMNPIIQGMLMKTPSRRIQTAAEVIKMINRAQ